MIFGPAVHVPSDAGAAEWIEAALGTFGSVGGLVPRQYERCLLLEPQHGEEPPGRESDRRLFEQLVPLLTAATSTPQRCWFAVWEGHGFTSFTTSYAAHPGDDVDARAVERERRRLLEADERRKRTIRAGLEALPTFDLPHRRYHLLLGSVAAAPEIEDPVGEGPQPPDLWWPDDRRWFVGGDTDLDWWYLAGTDALTSAVAAELGDGARPVPWTASNAAVGSPEFLSYPLS